MTDLREDMDEIESGSGGVNGVAQRPPQRVHAGMALPYCHVDAVVFVVSLYVSDDVFANGCKSTTIEVGLMTLDIDVAYVVNFLYLRVVEG